MKSLRTATMEPRQIDIRWSEPEAFALAVQTTIDGERVIRDQAQSEANKQESETKQEQFNV